MSEIDPDIQMPDEEPSTPAEQSPPQPPDEMTDADAEESLEKMQELLDQIESLEKESDGEALKEIERRLPQNQEPGEGNTATDPLDPEAGQNEKVDQAVAPVGEPAIETPGLAEDETKSEGAGDFDIASLDDDLALLLEDIDQVVVQAESDSQDDSESEPGGIAKDAGEAGEVGESAGLDTGGDEIVAVTKTQDATAAPSPASEPNSTDAESPADVGETSLEADIEAVLAQALKPSPAEPESTSEPATPVESVENDTPPDTSDAADPGGVEPSIDITSEIDALLSQVKAEQTAKPPEPTRKPVAPAPETISSAPAGEDSERNDLSRDLDDLMASVQPQTESDEKSESSESPAPAEAIDSVTQDTDQTPDIASEATPAESKEPTATPVLEQQKKESTPKEIKPLPNVPLTQQDMAMRALDEAMADDVAQMVAGDSEAIEKVLDGIFDEQAILVQNEEDFMNESAPGGMMQSDNPVGDRGAESGPPSDTPMETASDIGEVIDEEIAALASPETRKETSTTSVSDMPETDEKSSDQAAQKPAAATKVADAAEVEATKVADAAEVEAAPAEPQLAPAEQEHKWKERVQAAFEIIEPPLVTVLTGMNYPLRKIPEQFRPAVDWLALSLVFWVPIVWVLALFVMR